MAEYRYVAKRDGERYTGVVHANNRFEVYRHIRKEGGTLISLHKKGEHRFSFATLNAKLSTVTAHEKIVFATNLAAMVDAGLSLSRALTVSIRQTKNPKLKAALQEMHGMLEAGTPFHVALAQHPKLFPPLFVAMVRAGEESGNLADALKRIAEQMERTYTLKKKIKGAMIYPSIIIVAIIGIGILMMVKVVPTLAQTFKELNAELPRSTKVIIAISEFMQTHLVITAVLFVLFALSFFIVPRTRTGRLLLDWVTIHTPLIKTLSQEVNAARMARTLSSLLSSGIDIVRALTITEAILQNHYHRRVLKDAADLVTKGAPLFERFSRAEHLFPPLVTEMIAVGEETGSLPELLGKIADFYEKEVAQKTKDMSTIIEPFLMLIIGAAVGFFAVSMILPIYSVGNSI